MPGRPSKSSELDVDEYHRLRLCGQTDKAVALKWDVSERTLRRWKTINVDGKLRGEDLEAAIRGIEEVDPNAARGYRSVQAHFVSQGISVSRDDVMETMRRIDPAATEARRTRVIHRRSYNSPGPGNCWHVDTWHKANRYSIVVSGGVDGYSKLIAYLRVADNNTSRTHLRAFAGGARELGVPLATWGDAGGENVLIHDFQFHHRGPSGWRTVKSVHNTPIERFWRDMRVQAMDTFRFHWWELEVNHFLDIGDALDIWALQYMYLPLVQHRLDAFRLKWNTHKIRTKVLHMNIDIRIRI